MKRQVKIIGLIIILALLWGVSPVWGQEEHKKIVEEVSVSWWLVPMFAVDNDGRPLRYLKAEDLEVTLNGKIMKNFDLQRRSYSVTERTQQTVQSPSAEQVPVDKKKMIFLLFDQALSGETSLRRSKDVAKQIIMDAEKETHFFLMTIDAFSGLVFVGEGKGTHKTELLRKLKKLVIQKQRKRIVNTGEFMMNVDGRRSRYEAGESTLFEEAAAKPFKRESMGFFSAFETLYFYLNSIDDNKFVYLFSEGMSTSILNSNRSIAGARGMYQYYLKKIAEFINRSGAVFFMINTMGVDQHTTSSTSTSQGGGAVRNSFSTFSGEEFLEFLARKSGGTYLEGVNDEIVERIENMNLAYYEISFPDPPQLKEEPTREIIIKPKQKGIKIYTLRSLERGRRYDELKSVEKDMLVLNLVTQPPNRLFKGKLDVYNASVEKKKKNKKEVVYSVKLPPSYLKQNLDLYKVWLELGEGGSAQLQKIEKEAISPQKDKINISFPLAEEKKQKEDQETKKEIQAYFVLVNKGAKPARASVYGFELYDEDPELPEEPKPVFTQIVDGEKVTDKDLDNILLGVADYCDRLKQSVFHFYCKEKIVETRLPLTDADMKNPYIDEATMKKGVVRALDDMRNKAYTKVSGYLFGYRLLKKGSNITEERDFISSRDNVKVDRDQVVKTNAFFSEKAVLAPITIFDRSRQSKYEFKFHGVDKYHGRRAAVVEAAPKNPVETATIYGRVWIDTSDFSVMKIEANPKSIRSYDLLKDFARKIRTRLKLSLEIEFDKLYKGIRFPTKVSMMEKYKGGQIIRKYRGVRGWERTRTEFHYNDYQFFDIKTDVEINK